MFYFGSSLASRPRSGSAYFPSKWWPYTAPRSQSETSGPRSAADKYYTHHQSQTGITKVLLDRQSACWHTFENQ